MAESFFDFFPTPKFLEMPSPGLSLSDGGIHYIEFGEGKHGHTLKNYAEVAIPEGLIISGKIENPQGLISVLESFRKEQNIQYVRTTLPDERAYLYSTEVPNVDMKDLRTAVESTLEENVPLSVAEVVFDYNILKTKNPSQKKDTLRVSVSVIPREVVEEYLQVFQGSGFTPLHFEIESQAVAKAVVPREENRTFLVVNIGKDKTGVSIVSDEQVAFTSTVVTSADHRVLFDEIKKVTVYWQTQADRRNEVAESFERIFVCGEEGSKPEVLALFPGNTSIPAEVANVWTNVFSLKEYIPDITLEKSLAYASAIGVAIKNHTVQ